MQHKTRTRDKNSHNPDAPAGAFDNSIEPNHENGSKKRFFHRILGQSDHSMREKKAMPSLCLVGETREARFFPLSPCLLLPQIPNLPSFLPSSTGSLLTLDNISVLSFITAKLLLSSSSVSRSPHSFRDLLLSPPFVRDTNTSAVSVTPYHDTWWFNAKDTKGLLLIDVPSTF